MKKANYTFDEVARSERYYTSCILPILLCHDNFFLLKEFFKECFPIKDLTKLNDDFEIVVELDPLRDGSVYNEFVKGQYKQNHRMAVPDLFLRWDTLVLVIEAKFFTFPDTELLDFQIEKQREAIDCVLNSTKYKKCKIEFLALTIHTVKSKFIVFKWQEIVKLSKKIKNPPSQVNYAIKILKEAVKRAEEEYQKPNVQFKKYESLDKLLNDLPLLLKEGRFYFGFSEGEEVLESASLETLTKRSHFRVSNCKYSENWYTLDKLVKKYIEVKSLSLSPVS